MTMDYANIIRSAIKTQVSGTHCISPADIIRGILHLPLCPAERTIHWFMFGYDPWDYPELLLPIDPPS